MQCRALLLVLLLVPAAQAISTHSADAPQPILAPLGADLEAIETTLRLPAATWYNDKDEDRIFDSLETQFQTVPAGQTLPVIATTTYGASVAQVLSAAQSITGGFEPRYVYHQVGGWAADLTLAQVTAIAGLDNVRQVEWSQPGAPELGTSTYHTGVDAVQELLGVDGDQDGMPGSVSGEDVVIAILDTGFDGLHEDLAGKFVTFVDWSDGGKESDQPYDSGNHGTHVASIAAGLGVANSDYKGVAPGAGIAGYLISSSDTKGAAIASIDHILANPQLGVRVLTISFGFGTTVDGTDALELAMDLAWENGVVNFKSTGNSGPERGTVTIPGGARGIIGTASLFDPGESGFHLSGFSSRGPTADGRLKPDIAAPGSNIMAASAGSGNEYVSLSGTSMASPHAAGVAALVIDADPLLTPDEVRAILTLTAQDWGPEGHDIDYGHGRIDALAAVQRALMQKAVREQWSFDEVQSINVTGPDTPRHEFFDWAAAMALNSVSFDYEVEEANQPLAATFILDAVEPLPLGARAFVVFVEAPSGVGVETISLDPIARQQVVSLPTAEVGTYTMRFQQILTGDRIFLDVSSGLAPPPTLKLPTPEGSVAFTEATYTQAAGAPEGPGAEAVNTPGLGVLLVMALLGALAVVRRRA